MPGQERRVMESVAPWAEPVLMTASDLLRLSDEAWRYELVDGRLVRMSPTGGSHGRMVMVLLRALDRFVEENDRGVVFPPETGFWISSPGEADTVLAPDIAFVRRERERDVESTGYPRLAPDLVFEVASPSQGRAELGVKARRWLDAGVHLVWLVLPQSRTVEVWRRDGQVHSLTRDEHISGEDVLPGFTVPLADLFRDTTS